MQPGDLGGGLGMAKHRQRERRFRDEDVAGNRHERQACRVGAALVVARGDDAEPPGLDRDLGRAEDMAGRMKGDGDLADPHGLAELRGLRPCRKPLRVAHGHDLQRLGGGEDCGVSGAGMVGMAVGDQRPLDRPNRVDMEFRRASNEGPRAKGRGGLPDAWAGHRRGGANCQAIRQHDHWRPRQKNIGAFGWNRSRPTAFGSVVATATIHWRFGYPIAVATFRFVVAFVFLPETRPRPSSPMDWRSPRWGSGALHTARSPLCGEEAAARSSRIDKDQRQSARRSVPKRARGSATRYADEDPDEQREGWRQTRPDQAAAHTDGVLCGASRVWCGSSMFRRSEQEDARRMSRERDRLGEGADGAREPDQGTVAAEGMDGRQTAPFELVDLSRGSA